MMEYLRGHHYGLDIEVKTVVRLWFHHQETQFYCDELMNRWQTGGAFVQKQLHTVKP